MTEPKVKKQKQERAPRPSVEEGSREAGNPAPHAGAVARLIAQQQQCAALPFCYRFAATVGELLLGGSCGSRPAESAQDALVAK